jgi:hypothetical protein
VTIDNNGFSAAAYDPVAVVAPGATAIVYLAWNDPSGASLNDYDLYLVPLTCGGIANNLPAPTCTTAGTAVASSTNPQTGTQDPAESISWTNSSGSPVTVGIAIQNVGNSAAVRTFDMFVVSPNAKTSSPNHNFNTASGSVAAQNDAGGVPASVITVGAIKAGQCSSADNCSGEVEAYSSQGPTQTTPQAAGRTKPDIVAVDEVCITGAGNFGQADQDSACSVSSSSTAYAPRLFGGTSAAAPHVAAIAALLLQTAPCLLSSSGATAPATARAALWHALLSSSGPAASTNYPVPLPGYSGSIPNNQEGFGLVDAYNSIVSLLPPSGVTPTPSMANATSSKGAQIQLSLGTTSPPLSGCQYTAIQWSGDCGSGTAGPAQAVITCPIGINRVSTAVSYNGTSFLPVAASTPFTVMVSDFTLAASPTVATVSPGSTVTFNIGGFSSPQGTFSSPITLQCLSGLPPGASCSFSTTMINLGTTAGAVPSSTLTIFTQAYTSDRKSPKDLRGLWYGSPLVLAGFMLWTRLPRRTRVYRLLSVCFLFSGLLLLSSCDSSHPVVTSPTTYTIMVGGSSNQLQHTANIMLTLQ